MSAPTVSRRGFLSLVLARAALPPELQKITAAAPSAPTSYPPPLARLMRYMVSFRPLEGYRDTFGQNSALLAPQAHGLFVAKTPLLLRPDRLFIAATEGL